MHISIWRSRYSILIEIYNKIKNKMASQERKPYDFEDAEPEDVLRSYTAYKAWRTRTANKITMLMQLQTQSFSKVTYDKLNKGIEDLEWYTDMLSSLADWLTLHKAPRAEAHVTECKTWSKECEDLGVKVLQLCHEQSIAAPGGQGGPLAVATPSAAKPQNELKPDKLCHDASMTLYRAWKDEFRAYHSASNLSKLTLPCQHAFLLKCVDVNISMRLKRLKTDTTPLFPVAGANSCIDIINEFFRERNPLMIRRRAFFNYRQSEGQDIMSFRENLRSLADECDIGNMTLEETLCLMYAVGVRDDKLREKLYEIPEPTLTKFNTVMDAWVQKNRQMDDHDKRPATAMKVGDKNKKKETPKRTPLSEEEKSRRRGIKGRCFRCGQQDHMMPACKVSASISCNICKVQGHMAVVCGKTNARVIQGDQQQQQFPAIDYFPQGATGAAAQYVGSSFGVSNYNRPTPEAPL